MALLRTSPRGRGRREEERMDFTDDGDDEKGGTKAPPVSPDPANRPAPHSTPYDALLSRA